jgi:hypothetical protein
MGKIHLTIVLLIIFTKSSNAQVLLNEVQSVNINSILDENGRAEDWIELYNPTNNAISLQNYGLSDRVDNPFKWKFPNVSLAPQGRLLVFASGRNITQTLDHWETAIYAGDFWNYFEGNSEPPSDWYSQSFSGIWNSGPGGIGYGDGDDATTISPATSLYMRRNFTINDTSKIVAGILSMDYDDGFIAYLNGVEIARSCVQGIFPPFDQLASCDHEAAVYQGGNFENFTLDVGLLKSIITNGVNVLAIQVHNVTTNSSDLTAIPYLHFGMKDAGVQFGVPPGWFTNANANLHTNFTLNPNGETVVLTSTSGILQDSITINLSAGLSHARSTDGGAQWCITDSPTPAQPNSISTCFTGFAADVDFSQNAGFFIGPFSVILGPNIPGTTIRYTTNGQIPTLTSNLYSSPITISQTSVLKARRFSNNPNVLPGKIETNSYFINEPTTLPIISLTTNDENLYGPDGIYDNYWTDWKKPVYVEYFDTLHHQKFEQNAGIKIDGGAGGSRGNPQKSFRVEPQNDQYGDGDVEYPLIPDRISNSTYATFYLRNGSNYWNAMPYKDAWIVKTMAKSNTAYSAYTPVTVFLNGQYWGLYELREKQDKDYFKNNYGADTRNLDILSVSYFYGGSLRTVTGSDTGWYNMYNKFNALNATDPDFLKKAGGMLDLDDYTDYMIAQTWFGNYDWPYNNIKIWRSRNTDNKWHYSLIDLELALGGWSGPWDDFINWVYPGPNGTHTEFFSKLMQNPTYRKNFINRNADLMNTLLLPQKIAEEGEPMRQQILPELARQFGRWADTINTPASQLINDLVNLHDYHNYLFSIRSPYVWEHTKSAFSLVDTTTIVLQSNPPGGGYIKINTITPENLPWSGVYYNGNPVTIRAIANPGYTFQNWSSVGTSVNGNQITKEVNISTYTTITANFTGSSQTAGLSINEVNYNQDSSLASGDWIELRNNGPAIDISDWKIHDSQPLIKYTFPAGTVIPPNGYLVIASDTLKFDAQHNGVNRQGGTLWRLSNKGESITLKDRFDNIYQSLSYADSLPWPECADGLGRTLNLKPNTTDINNPSNWFCGTVGGTPGQPHTDYSKEKIKIDEINYNSLSTADAGDWLEIVNTGVQPYNLSGWILKDGQDDHLYTIPQGTQLAPNARLVICNNLSQFQSIYPNVINAIGNFNFGLGNGGDAVRLYNNNGKLHFSLVFDDNNGWPTTPDGQGFTLQLKDASDIFADVCVPDSWMESCFLGTPGSAYLPCDFALENSISSGNWNISPNPAQDELWIQIPFGEEVSSLKIIDLQGRTVLDGFIIIQQGNQRINVNQLKSGIYFLNIKDKNQKTRIFKWVKL